LTVVELALALGIAVNLVFTEVFGLASGGLVVPGYLALHLDQPGRLLSTFVIALLTWLAVRHGLMRVMVLYGRRRFGVTILAGFVIQGAYTTLLGTTPALPADMRAVGYLIPGLLANTAITQGVWPTVTMSVAGAIIVRLLLALLSAWVA
jgi:poly-gamma-glutamate biosynthesis protein PgsC/CapC